MYPIILERDTHIHGWDANVDDWSTTTSSAEGDAYRVVSDGLLHIDYATAYIAELCNPLAGKMEGFGLHITQPETEDEFTPYSVHALGMTEDPLLRPFLFIGISPATITSAATGNLLSNCRIIAVADYDSDTGGCLEKNMTVVVPKMPVGLETRALCFGIGMMAGTVNAANAHAWANLSVRRLVGNSPAIIDTRKL